MPTQEEPNTFTVLYDESIFIVKAPSRELAIEKVNKTIDASLKEDYSPETLPTALAKHRRTRRFGITPACFNEDGVALVYQR